MNWLTELQVAAGRMTALCLAAAALEAVLWEEDGALCFQSMCRLTLLLALLRMISGLLG